MAKYLVDVNLPSRFSVWKGEQFEYVIHFNDEWKDSQIWEYARTNGLTIVTKDADFSEMMLLNEPPPRVIHIKLGNIKMSDFHQLISKTWDSIKLLSEKYKLIRVYADRIEGID
ncbi:MAG: hypothetical protein DWQ10_06310 [Calditrichaeota bacterium]|nr:MAG: hypothetical protein DWQ10_06310 [Calditrichota bacterium]